MTKWIMGIMALIAVADAAAEGQMDIDKGYMHFDISGFTQIMNTTSARLFITYGESFKIEAEGSDQFLRSLQITKRGDELQIRNKWGTGIHFDRGIIHISLPQIEGLKLTGSGDAEMQDPFYSDHFQLTQTGSGNSELIIECDRMKATLTGSGDALIQGTIGTLDLNQTGSGNCEILGFITELTSRQTGSGDFDGTMLKAQIADIILTGSGKAELTVEEELSAKISGSGDLIFKGNPRLGTILATGSGKLINREED